MKIAEKEVAAKSVSSGEVLSMMEGYFQTFLSRVKDHSFYDILPLGAARNDVVDRILSSTIPPKNKLRAAAFFAAALVLEALPDGLALTAKETETLTPRAVFKGIAARRAISRTTFFGAGPSSCPEMLTFIILNWRPNHEKNYASPQPALAASPAARMRHGSLISESAPKTPADQTQVERGGLIGSSNTAASYKVAASPGSQALSTVNDSTKHPKHMAAPFFVVSPTTAASPAVSGEEPKGVVEMAESMVPLGVTVATAAQEFSSGPKLSTPSCPPAGSACAFYDSGVPVTCGENRNASGLEAMTLEAAPGIRYNESGSSAPQGANNTTPEKNEIKNSLCSERPHKVARVTWLLEEGAGSAGYGASSLIPQFKLYTQPC